MYEKSCLLGFLTHCEFLYCVLASYKYSDDDDDGGGGGGDDGGGGGDDDDGGGGGFIFCRKEAVPVPAG